MIHISSARAALASAFALGLALSIPAVAEEGTVEAFSSWEARGQLYPTGPEEATFVGSLSGVIYIKGDGVELDASTLDAGVITCPAVLTINTSDGTQKGQGRCLIMTPDAERVYAKFECTGSYQQGCNGEFTLNGGTGDKADVTGGGPIQFKSALGQLVQSTPGSIVQQSAVGLAVWPKLTYKVPARGSE
ncbi:MAG: hypothetical protein ACU85U_05450 [Gammaproteobacteria bacterium]|jgi:hypothetical protein